MSNSDSASFEVGNDVLHKPIDDGLVLLNVKNRRFYELDNMGARVWYLLLKHGNVPAVADRLCEEYDADRSRILPDVESMALNLCASGLLKSLG